MANRSGNSRTSSNRKKSTGKAKAGTGRRTSSTRSATASRRSASKAAARRGQQEERNDLPILGEVILWIVLAVSVLIFLSIVGVVGRYGQVLSRALFGVYGTMAYVFPFALFFGYAVILVNRKNRLIVRKSIGFILLFQFTAAFLQLLMVDYSRSTSLGHHYLYAAEYQSGGGVVGAAIVMVFGYLFGKIGALIFTICAIVISTLIMTQKPLFTILSERSATAASRAKELHDQSKAEKAEIRELKKDIRREEKRLRHENRLRDLQEESDERMRRLKEAAERRADRDPGSFVDDEYYEDLEDSFSKHPLRILTLEQDDITDEKAPDPAAEKGTNTKNIKSTKSSKSEPDRKTVPVKLPDEQEDHAFPFDELSINGRRVEPFEMPAFLKNHSDRSAKKHEERSDEDASSDTAFSAEADPQIMPSAQQTEKASDRKRTSSSSRRSKTAADSTPDANEKPSSDSLPDVSADQIASEIAKKVTKKVFRLPPIELLTKGDPASPDSDQNLMATAAKLQTTLQTFGVNVKVVNISCGPTVTRYELQPELGVKVSKIMSLQNDIMLNLATSSIRIEAPIPGKAAVGIEIPNREKSPVMLRDLLESPEFRNSKAKIPFAVGKDIAGKPIISDIEKMPHLLIAGATGSGKSVCINTLIMSILYRSTPEQVKLLMIDPKVVELKVYDGIPHLLIPVVTDAKKAAGALNWAVREMTDRYNKFAAFPGVRDIRSYNERIQKQNIGQIEEDKLPPMPRIVVIVDELADLMMVASGEVEDAICRLSQLARAAGIHLIIATQRPSVNVVTGLIKANMPSRIALAVSSGVDSRTILDANGAEKLLGHGDMLFAPQDYQTPARIQGCYVPDENITAVVEFLASQSNDVEYNTEVEEMILSAAPGIGREEDDERDEYFADSGRLIIEKDKASVSMLQRAFKIGFNRAARIMDQLANCGVVGGEDGTKTRKILMTLDEFEQLLKAE